MQRSGVPSTMLLQPQRGSAQTKAVQLGGKVRQRPADTPSQHPRQRHAGQQQQTKTGGKFVSEPGTYLRRAAVGPEHRIAVELDQIVEAGMKPGEFLVV